MPPSEDPSVVLLDEHARQVGTLSKSAAHAAGGRPHLAFSVLLHDADGRVLLQRRAAQKHHFAGLWANSCCSHPRPGQPLLEAARERLCFELNLRSPPNLKVWAAFWYRAVDSETGLVEHEYDVVLIGRLPTTAPLTPNQDEVADLAWFHRHDAELLAQSRRAAPWLRLVLSAANARRESVPQGLVHGQPS